MNPSIRTQIDGLEDEYSLATALDTSADPMLTRQEYKDEADLNILLSRFGVPGARPMTWGQEIDWNTDLQQALGAMEQAKSVENTVPEELKSKYPTWRHVLNAVENGAYGNDLKALAEQKAKDKAAADRAAAEKATGQT